MVVLMNSKTRYNKRLTRLLTTNKLVYKGKKHLFRKENVDLAIEFLKEREKYLQNVNGYEEEAQKRYYKTLDKEFTYVQNVLVWFNKWNLKDITEDIIKEIYEGIEKGEITSVRGKELSQNTKKDYYSKVLRNGFFKFIGKDEIAKKVILRSFSNNEEVRFFDIDTLKKLASHLKYADHKLLVWLLFDTGIEVNGVLELKKSDFSIETPKDMKPYYILHMRKEIGKKGRQQRNPYIYHDETNILLKEHLSSLKDDDKLFNFKWRNAYKFINETSKKYNLKLVTPNSYIKPKDFRSSMATFFLIEGWNTDEIKARLGHKPSSTVIDRYVNYLGINQKHKKKEKEEIDFKNYKDKYTQIQERNRRLEEKIKSYDQDMELIKEFMSNPEVMKAIQKVRAKS